MRTFERAYTHATCFTRGFESECDHRDTCFSSGEQVKSRFKPCCSHSETTMLLVAQAIARAGIAPKPIERGLRRLEAVSRAGH